MTRLTAAAFLVIAGLTLPACDAILGIDVFPDLDAGGDAAPPDATLPDATAADTAVPEGATPDVTGSDAHDAAVDAPDATLDAPSDASDASDATDAADATGEAAACDHPCLAGTSTCVDGGLSICQIVFDPALDAGCEKQLAPIACSPGEVCRGAAGAASCCSGTAAACAPSCNAGGPAGTDGGPTHTCGSPEESCCTSLPVTGGSYKRSYDGVFNTDPNYPATVSTFALDKYEVTVGRFRAFANAWSAGWRPQPGSGVHTHLNGGKGLADSSSGSFEPGWTTDWNANLPTSPDPIAWSSVLNCGNNSGSTWTQSPGANEDLPITCIQWFEAYAFCIWDGGFLPSEVEWEYAAAGGGGSDGQRVYAWSAPPASTTIDCSYANYRDCGIMPVAVGAASNGAGKWGQLDLTGNEWEWALDYYATYVNPCVDCAYLGNNPSLGRVLRGSGFNYLATESYVASARVGDPDTLAYGNDGIRCARAAP
jgi:formylglycine-generating enzyme required for sulfatase activity